MRIETIEIAGLASALKALRLPYNKGTDSEIDTSVDIYDANYEYDNGESVITNYIATSSDIVVSPDDVRLMQVLIKRGDSHAKPLRGILAYAEILAPIDWWVEVETYRAGHERLFSASTMHTEGKSLHGKALRRELDKISFGREICKVDFFSYQCLRNIVKQRFDHRKMEWHEFIEWIKSLPLAEDLILVGCEEEIRKHDELYKMMKEEE